MGRATAITLCMLVSLWSSGCFRRTPVGYFDERAFYNSRQHYRVRYISGTSDLLPPGWRLDNFQMGEDGRPVRARQDMMVWQNLDRDGDGLRDRLVHDYIWDLRFQHVHDDALIWSQTIPIDGVLAQRTLPAISRRFVEAFVDDDNGGKRLPGAAPVTRRVARLVADGPASVHGVRAHRVIFEVIEVDLGNRVSAVVQAVLVQPDARWNPSGGAGAQNDWPMVVLFGYASSPAAFSSHYPEFEGFVNRVDFRESLMSEAR